MILTLVTFVVLFLQQHNVRSMDTPQRHLYNMRTRTTQGHRTAAEILELFEQEPSDFEDSASDTEAQTAEEPIELTVEDIDTFPDDTADDSDEGPAFLKIMGKSGWISEHEDSDSNSDSNSNHRPTPAAESTDAGKLPIPRKRKRKRKEKRRHVQCSAFSIGRNK